MARVHLLRVFCEKGGHGGNPLAVFLDGAEVAPESRQGVAADLGLSETVFVDDAERGDIQIFTPTVELGFAGHPTVGTAWLLAEGRVPVELLRVPAGELAVRYEHGMTFITAHADWPDPFEWEQLASPEEVDALEGPPRGHDLIGAWAWLDESSGAVRARVFPVRLGIAEDEATGSAAVRLCAALDRELDIHQGAGSRIIARPRGEGWIEIGGRAVLDEVRDYAPL